MKGSMQITFLLALAMLMALPSISLSTSTLEEDRNEFFSHEDNDLPTILSQTRTTSLRGASRFLATRPTATTCDKNPKVCKAKGSAGRDCCKKKCVDFKTDRANCGKCGKKCKYSEICCKGKCLNPMADKKNCGRCNNKCKKGSSCVYGMCSYA